MFGGVIVKEFQKPFQIYTPKGLITQAHAPSNQFLKTTAPKGLDTQACFLGVRNLSSCDSILEVKAEVVPQNPGQNHGVC